MADLLLTARRNAQTAKFWQYAEEDEHDAPPAMKALIAGQNPVPVTQEEAEAALAWCEGRVGWMPFDAQSFLTEQFPVAVLSKTR
jgi:hypothetical protein